MSILATSRARTGRVKKGSFDPRGTSITKQKDQQQKRTEDKAAPVQAP
ncbi:hypothetical protein SS05631_b50950 (plasmid) [Sinorhizobium sp. CCBAU 05631]|nr:hypothetical protein SS05631_b50950 [Sinorhizobium sp. CCBAU 05631]